MSNHLVWEDCQSVEHIPSPKQLESTYHRTKAEAAFFFLSQPMSSAVFFFQSCPFSDFCKHPLHLVVKT
jgi:hypothetical protein